MTGLVRKATLLSACGLLLAGAAMAGIPNAANSTIQKILVTDFPSTPPGPNLDAVMAYSYTSCIKDGAGNAVQFAAVTVDFSTCGTDVQIGSLQEDGTLTVDCLGMTITKTADVNGCVVLGPFIARSTTMIAGWPDAPGTSPSRNIGPGAPVSCAKVYAGGQLMATVGVVINRFDPDEDLDVDGGDGGYHGDAVGQYFVGGIVPNPPYRMFYDYDGDEDVDAGDGGLLLDAIGQFFLGTYVPYPGPYCP